MPAVPVAIGLGSNLGPRLATLGAAIDGLGAAVEVRRCSAVYETAPMHVEDQPLFLNACCVGETELAARPLLEALLELERRAGRRRPERVRYGPRELDLDLLLYGDTVIVETDFHVPHPRMGERPFVLWPLAEIAGRWIHPETGRTIADMAADLRRDGLRPFAPASALREKA